MRNSHQTRNSLLLALLATGVMAAGALAAAPQDGKGRGGHMAVMLAKADANKDGNISQAEHDAVHASRLAQLDRNKDGFVTYDEHKAAMELRAREGFAKRHDKNGDGRVSVDEMADGGERMFQRMDADKDGMITAEEMKQRSHGARKGMRRGAEGPRAPVPTPVR